MACNVPLEWDSAKRLITAYRLDGAVLRLDMSSNTAIIKEHGQEQKVSLSSKGYIENGVTYLPLRVVSELLHCGVEWNNRDKSVLIENGFVSLQAKDGMGYLVDLSNGCVYCGSSAEYVGNCGITDYFKLGKEAYSLPENWQLQQTAGGILLSCDYVLEGAVTHINNFAAYLNTATKKGYCCGGDVFWQYSGDMVYMQDDEGDLLEIDDITGQVTKISLSGILAGISDDDRFARVTPVAVDGNYIFFHSRLRTNLFMLDIVNRRIVDFEELLQTDEVIAATGIPADDYSWRGFGDYVTSPDLDLRFEFVKLEDGVLYVELRGYCGRVVMPLEYRYR